MDYTHRTHTPSVSTRKRARARARARANGYFFSFFSSTGADVDVDADGDGDVDGRERDGEIILLTTDGSGSARSGALDGSGRGSVRASAGAGSTGGSVGGTIDGNTGAADAGGGGTLEVYETMVRAYRAVVWTAHVWMLSPMVPQPKKHSLPLPKSHNSSITSCYPLLPLIAPYNPLRCMAQPLSYL